MLHYADVEWLADLLTDLGNIDGQPMSGESNAAAEAKGRGLRQLCRHHVEGHCVLKLCVLEQSITATRSPVARKPPRISSDCLTIVATNRSTRLVHPLASSLLSSLASSLGPSSAAASASRRLSWLPRECAQQPSC